MEPGTARRTETWSWTAHLKETRFEGTTAFVKEIKGPTTDCPDAMYEIHVLENLNLQYVAIGDTCSKRSIALNLSEWAPVP
jgi:hypothetical protein